MQQSSEEGEGEWRGREGRREEEEGGRKGRMGEKDGRGGGEIQN